MSAPSSAIFFKYEKPVGIGFCNIGWFFDNKRLIKCVFEAWNHAHFFFEFNEDELKNRTNLNNKQKEIMIRDHNKLTPYFKTKQDLMEFDHVCLYGFCIPRDIINQLYQKTLTLDEFEQKIKDGSFRNPSRGIREFYDKKD